MARLTVRDLRVRYGQTEILKGVSFDLAPGKIVALLGANGSGKSTALNAISGFVKPTHGSIRFDGAEIAGHPTHKVFRCGIVQVSQGRDLFGDMTVEENLLLGMANCPPSYNHRQGLATAYRWFPKLIEKKAMRAQALSGGEQQMVAIGRALVSRPRVILLDEPSGGLAPLVLDEISRILVRLKEEGHTMLIVEQNVSLARVVADQFCILRDGEIIAGDDIVNSASSTEEIVRAVYL